MSVKWLSLAGAAGLVMVGAAVPAEAQYYPPPQPYPPQQQYPPQQPYYPPQQPYPQQQYPQQQYPQQYPQQPYYPQQRPGGITGAIIDSVYGYGRYPYGNYGYETYGNQGYGIDRCARGVEARLNGNNYNWYGNYNNRRYRQSGRVEGITRVERKSYGLKVWGVASSGYGGYEGYGRRGYGTYGYNAGADLSFECKVYGNGQIRDIDIKRRSASWRGY